MKKRLVFILVMLIAINIAFGQQENIYVSALTDKQYSDTVYPMGDVNSDGEVNIADCLVFRNVLANSKYAAMDYSSADVTGDLCVDAKDLLEIRKKLAGYDVNFSETRFPAEYKDVTSELVDLGINNFDKWDNRNAEHINARNIFDMAVFGDKVVASCGNYNVNLGPVKINGYSRNTDSPIYFSYLGTEQVNRFYKYGKYLFALGIDPRNWGTGEIYTLNTERTSRIWMPKAVLANNIHCYDMIEYNGSYFFCGSNVSYKQFEGSNFNTELSKGVVYRYEGEYSTAAQKSDYKDIPFIDARGNTINYESYTTITPLRDTSGLPELDEEGNIKAYKNASGADHISTTGVPRVYEFFEFKGNLYAFYYDQYLDNYISRMLKDKNGNYIDREKYKVLYDYVEERCFNGLYKYDIEQDAFVYDSSVSYEQLLPCFIGNQDGEKIQHDFAWGDKYYFINDGLYVTDDFNNYSKVSIKGYEDYTVRDAIIRSGKVYLLAGKKKADDTYDNVVIETDKFESYRPLFCFNTKTFARSFEFCNGAFYFGLGTKITEKFENDTIVQVLEPNAEECGRIYRYIYYK